MKNTITYNDFKSAKHFLGLDGIRCLSIVAVMYFHFSGADGRLGILGVDLFFILSGFLITSLLLREREKSGRVNLKNFWIRRVLRIFPIYYGFILAQIVIFKVVSIDQELIDGFYNNLPAFLTFTNNWFVHLSDDSRVVFYHAWSLAAEEQFYLFWPPLVALALTTNRLIAIPASLILFDLTLTELIRSQIITLGQNEGAILTSIQPAICLGVIAALILNNAKYFNIAIKYLALKWLPSSMAVFAVILIVADVYHLLIHIVLTVFLVSVIFDRDKLASSVLNFTPVVFIGRISYGMYIFHMAAFNAVKILLFPSSSNNSVEVIATSFIVTIVVATASYYWYEKPIMSLKNKLNSKS